MTLFNNFFSAIIDACALLSSAFKHVLFEIIAVFVNFLKNPFFYHGFHKNIKLFFNINNIKTCFLRTKSA